jgi:hypothetical protein
MSQRLNDVYFCWWNQQPPKEGGGGFYTCPSKNSRWKLASRNQNIRFWKPEHPKFEIYPLQKKLDCLIFPDSARCVVYEAIMFHSSHLDF